MLKVEGNRNPDATTPVTLHLAYEKLFNGQKPVFSYTYRWQTVASHWQLMSLHLNFQVHTSLVGWHRLENPSRELITTSENLLWVTHLHSAGVNFTKVFWPVWKPSLIFSSVPKLVFWKQPVLYSELYLEILYTKIVLAEKARLKCQCLLSNLFGLLSFMKEHPISIKWNEYKMSAAGKHSDL